MRRPPVLPLADLQAALVHRRHQQVQVKRPARCQAHAAQHQRQLGRQTGLWAGCMGEAVFWSEPGVPGPQPCRTWLPRARSTWPEALCAWPAICRSASGLAQTAGHSSGRSAHAQPTRIASSWGQPEYGFGPALSLLWPFLLCCTDRSRARRDGQVAGGSQEHQAERGHTFCSEVRGPGASLAGWQAGGRALTGQGGLQVRLGAPDRGQAPGALQQVVRELPGEVHRRRLARAHLPNHRLRHHSLGGRAAALFS